MVIAAIVPARNEGARIGATVRALGAIGEITETIVVDDASSDATAQLALEAGAQVVHLRTHRGKGRGKGGALRAGLERTTAEILVFIDGDLGATAEIARILLAPVVAGDADMSIAAPSPGRPSGLGLVEGLSRAGIRLLTGRRFARPLSGQRAIRRHVIARGSLAPRFGVETALTIDAVRAGFRVVEIPVEFEHARTERTAAGFSHRARQGGDVVLALLSRLRQGSARA